MDKINRKEVNETLFGDEMNVKKDHLKDTKNTNTQRPKESLKSPHSEKTIELLKVQRSQVAGVAAYANNPFERLESVFKDISLINIQKKTMPIVIPMLTDEDITAYASSIREWIEHNKNIAKERQDV